MPPCARDSFPSTELLFTIVFPLLCGCRNIYMYILYIRIYIYSFGSSRRRAREREREKHSEAAVKLLICETGPYEEVEKETSDVFVV